VVRAFVAYEDAALPPASFMLIADDAQTYVGVTGGVAPQGRSGPRFLGDHSNL